MGNALQFAFSLHLIFGFVVIGDCNTLFLCMYVFTILINHYQNDLYKSEF